ncbi:LysR substrate-binding domain-containing protein [Robbsia sp. KACC 23696]|uniref:LysR substrate-binding domain-containing protein n=1 Tax=Robbsia sp. KACC 23696 TaxID=3149231 RepID=UPI00325A817E
MRFDLTDLRLFLSVVDTGSLTRGAQEQHLSLAAVSERIAGMEAALGTPLLSRNRRGVSPTAAGEALVRHARAILGQIEHMRGELRAYATGLKGRITFLANSAALAGHLPQHFTRFLLAYPDLSIDLDERPSPDIVKTLAEGRADLGIVADFADLTAVQTRLLMQDQLAVIAHRSHPIVNGAPLAFADILKEAFIGLSDAALEKHLAERASRRGRTLDYRIRLRSVEDLADMVEAGVGVAVVSMASIQRLNRSGLAVSPLADGWATRRLHLCARDFDALTAHAALLAQLLIRSN